VSERGDRSAAQPIPKMMALLTRYAPLLLVLLAWEAASRLGLVSAQMLPPFSSVAVAFWGLLRDGDLVTNAAHSLWRALLGFSAAVVVGTLLGAGMALSRTVRLAVNPVVQFFYPLPKSALIPLVLIWFGLGDASKVVLIFLGCLLPNILGTYNGITGIDQSLVWSARSLGASRAEIFREVVLPAALPQILTGLQVALPTALIVAVIAEMMMGGYGLGGAMMTASRHLDSTGVFAGIVATALTGHAVISAMSLVRWRLLSWHPEAREPTTA